MSWKTARTIGVMAVAASLAAGEGLAATSALTVVKLPVTETQALAAAKARPSAQQLRQTLVKQGDARRVDVAKLDAGTVPVLVSPRAAFVQSLRVFPSAQHFTASAQDRGTAIQINGSRVAVPSPITLLAPTVPAEVQKALRAESPSATLTPVSVQPGGLHNLNITRTDDGVDVTFTRFGAAYDVSITCPRPKLDTNCTPLGALRLVREMEVVGGNL